MIRMPPVENRIERANRTWSAKRRPKRSRQGPTPRSDDPTNKKKPSTDAESPHLDLRI